MIDRLLDDSYPSEVRRDAIPFTVGRLSGNACYRFAPPFLAVIARGLHVSLDELGVALAISELSGFTTPFIGHWLDRLARRWTMSLGLLGVALGSGIAAASTGRVAFAVGLAVLSQSKVVYDLSLAAWISDHVPPERRGRVFGITETSWALGLLIGVSLLGVLAAATSWRFGYIAGGAVAAGLALFVAHRLRDDRPGGINELPERPAVAAVAVPTRILIARAWPAMLGAFSLMSASQCAFVTFGSWLKDSYGFGAARLSAVTFVLGGVELAASITAARRTDRWGKELSTAGGAAVMVPTMLLLVLLHEHLAVGLVLLGLALIGFEFAIISSLSVGTGLMPSAPARGLGLMFGAGTLGRAIVSVAATALYTAHGFGGPMLLGAGCAAAATVSFGLLVRRKAAATHSDS